MHAAEHVHQFGDLLSLIAFVAADDGVFHTMGDMVAKDFLLGAAQRRPHRGYLRHDIDAVAVVLDHAGEATHLPLDAAQALQHRCLCVRLHA